jgi:hypothetical protein
MDCGDYGMGFVANSLQLGCDCLGHIKYFDGVVNNAQVTRCSPQLQQHIQLAYTVLKVHHLLMPGSHEAPSLDSRQP